MGALDARPRDGYFVVPEMMMMAMMMTVCCDGDRVRPAKCPRKTAAVLYI